jgi:predicted nucleic acid-binding protein
MPSDFEKKIYLDVCCLNRPFDDQSQARVRLEAQAVLAILDRVGKAPDKERSDRVRLLTSVVSRTVNIEAEQANRARQLEELGFHAFDALHIACAESAKVDVMLTTDDRLLRVARRLKDILQVRVVNPLQWLEEML